MGVCVCVYNVASRKTLDDIQTCVFNHIPAPKLRLSQCLFPGKIKIIEINGLTSSLLSSYIII